MPSILNLLIAITLTTSAPVPSSTTTPATTAPTAAASAPVNCWCQTMPGKDWGK
jgi:hypothetical protein